jgi:sulfite reductase (NADPH) flavoprotein alpha-component
MSGSNTLGQNIAPSQEQIGRISPILQELEQNQLIWLSGYVAGLASQQQALPQTQNSPQESITILYGSQTGNAKGVAEELKSKLDQKGLPSQLVAMSSYRIQQLKKEKWLVVITSTQGNGEPPEDAFDFYEQFLSKRAPKAKDLNFSVVGLGDSSYEFYCQTGKDFDKRLEELGATRFLDRIDCDLDYEDAVEAWEEKFIAEVTPKLEAQTNVIPIHSTQAAPSKWTKANPFLAELLTNQKITGRNSDQDVRHIEISLEESGISYQPGDALGIKAKNSETLVQNILELLAIKPDTQLAQHGNKTVLELLINDYELTLLHPGFLKSWGELNQHKELIDLNREQQTQYLDNYQIIDIIKTFPGQPSAEDFISTLRKLTPRLYSISSSANAFEEEVHITVAKVEYDAFGFKHYGHASSFLVNQTGDEAKVNVYISENTSFRLPENNEAPIIMIGAGTGVAPYRAFLQERESQGHTGKNWLFFGARHFKSDFLYQSEWVNYRKSGLLTHIDVAFSRDQKEKIYVQHLLEKQGKEVFDWLENGAHLYICGAIQMGDDVHQALISLIQKQKHCEKEAAETYLTELRKAKRYHKDVY